MKTLSTIILLSTCTFGLYAGEISETLERELAISINDSEPHGKELSITPSQLGLSKRADVSNAVLVDSSQNGYGMIKSETNPISVDPLNHDQITLTYRQYLDGTQSGAIGVSHSVNGGANWATQTNINGGLSTNGGRYPSTLASENYPIAFWNESDTPEGIGRAYYMFDEGNYGGGFWLTARDIHNDPSLSNSWIVVPTQNVDANGNYIVNAAVTNWSGTGDHYLFRAQTSGAWNGTALPLGSAFTIVRNARNFDVDRGTTANGNMDINSTGTGYYVITGNWSDAAVIANHTLFVKKTIDYGASWSGWYTISDETLNNHFSSVFPDTVTLSSGEATLPNVWAPYIAIDLEVMADESGGLHILAPVLPSYDVYVLPTWEKNGIYHFYAASDALVGAGSGAPVPVVPEISFVADMQQTWTANRDGGNPSWSSNAISMAYDVSDENNLYMVYYTTDLMGSYSLDNGATWSKPHKISNTGSAQRETYPHLNRFAVDGNVYMVYQVPDFNHPTITGPTTTQDYLNHVYFLKYDMAAIVSTEDENTLPTAFILNDNYPNPFNPETRISFSVPTSGRVDLSVIDIRGRNVATLHNDIIQAGDHEFVFRAGNLPSGTYFYRLEHQGFQITKKMLILK